MLHSQWYSLLSFCEAASVCIAAVRKPQYITLPSLREQAALQDSWTKDRLENVPHLLQKYEVDAWLVGSFLPEVSAD